jgi:hypothetical protein
MQQSYFVLDRILYILNNYTITHLKKGFELGLKPLFIQIKYLVSII